MTIALWIVLTPLCLWVVFCAVVWIWYHFFGSKHDHSGDMGLAVLFLPVIPFVLAYHKIRELFEGK